jgi:hypothetical protein
MAATTIMNLPDYTGVRWTDKSDGTICYFCRSTVSPTQPSIGVYDALVGHNIPACPGNAVCAKKVNEHMKGQYSSNQKDLTDVTWVGFCGYIPILPESKLGKLGFAVIQDRSWDTDPRMITNGKVMLICHDTRYDLFCGQMHSISIREFLNMVKGIKLSDISESMRKVTSIPDAAYKRLLDLVKPFTAK